MTRRTRTLLIDGTTGTVYTGVTDTITASADKIAAGVKPKFIKTTIAKGGKNVVVVVGNKPINFGREVLINSIRLVIADRRGKIAATAAPQGRDMIVKIRKINGSNVESVLGTYSILSYATSSDYTVSFTISSTDLLFVDVTQVGSTKPGHGLSVTMGYFG